MYDGDREKQQSGACLYRVVKKISH